MDVLLMLTLPFLIFYGVITSYDDYKFGLIRNRWVVISILYGFLALIFFVLYLYLTVGSINLEYLLEFSLNFFSSILAGLIMWYGGLWSAGDAKLFIGYAVIIPISVYAWGYIYGFPSFILLINTFVPLFFYYLFLIMFKTSRKDKLEVIKEIFDVKNIFTAILFIFGFVWIIRLLITSTKIFTKYLNNIFIMVAILFLILFLLQRFLNIDMITSSIILSFFHIIFFYKTIFTIEFLKIFLLLTLLFLFIRYFIIYLGHYLFSKEVYIEDLKPGMIPAENIIIKDKEYYKKKITTISFLHGLLEHNKEMKFFHRVSDGLKDEEIKMLQKLHSSGEFKSHSIKIGLVTPFAHFMFIGAILTIIFKGNLIISLFKLFV